MLKRSLVIFLLLGCTSTKPVEVPEPPTTDQTEQGNPEQEDQEGTDASEGTESAENPDGVDSSDGSVGVEQGAESTNPTADAEETFAEEINNATAMLTSDGEAAKVALVQLQEILQKKDDIPQVHYNIGIAYLKMDDVESARQAFLKTTEVDPTFSKAWYNLGVLLEREGDFNGALQIYEEGLKHNEKDNDLIAGRIGCYRKMGQYDVAIKLAQEALKTN